MKTALRLLTLALCVFAWYENTLLIEAKPQPCKPSAAIDPVFHQSWNKSYLWVEFPDGSRQ